MSSKVEMLVVVTCALIIFLELRWATLRRRALDYATDRIDDAHAQIRPLVLELERAMTVARGDDA